MTIHEMRVALQRLVLLVLLVSGFLQMCTSTPVLAFNNRSSLNLAFMRIRTSRSRLVEAARAVGVTNLVQLTDMICKSELESVDLGLSASHNFLSSGKSEEAVRELLAVDNSLDTCMKNFMGDEEEEISTRIHQLRAIFEKIRQSVSSAVDLIDRSSRRSGVEPQESKNLEINPRLFQSVGSVDQTVVDEVADETLSAMADDDGPRSWGPQEESRSASTNSFSMKHLPLPPAIPSIMDEMMNVDYCSPHVELYGATATIRMDSSCGGKFHSRSKYSSGVFSVRMKPPHRASGVSSSFYISSNDEDPDLISFDFIGNHPNRILTSYAVHGKYSGTLQTFSMEFDTTAKLHDYTIKWDAESVIWMVDNRVLRTLRSSSQVQELNSDYPRKPGHVYGYLWDASDMNWAGKINWADGPFEMVYADLRTTSPLAVGQWHPPPAAPDPSAAASGFDHVPVPLQPIVIDYCGSNVDIQDSDNHHEFSILFDSLGCGGRIKSLAKYSTGMFSGKVKCADGDTSGLLTSLYVSSGEGNPLQDEIDFEFLGDNKGIVQTNFYVNGVGGHEQWIDLGFDCSQGFHTYAIHYNTHSIQWFVDSKLVRTVSRSEQVKLQDSFPAKRMRMYASVWNASGVENGAWTGPWRGDDLPFVAKFSDLTIQSPP
ncbi:hypothetical protein CY35_07G060700 [Sphagnum magellanicum]|jgi:beta-glucanase (GH16 family)|uniref:Uncharacterized protein n=1 Tax=Sphagnum magellanicum TaxID=128215 RepID=A0ACB8HL45_9BRYO|nr:hypothetical protein CY35_07G060700 [Sphagnum magellanicum]